ncbi:MAG: transcription antitermination factor NusB [FCB group bacterium]|nr:transcription antitermination factor NusB [FCB group bacterium]
MTTGKKHPRRLARESVLQALYALELTQDNPEKVIRDILSRYDFNEETETFVQDLYWKTVHNGSWIDEKITRHLENWNFDRVARLDRLILRLAISELYFIEDVPPKVSITEAIEIAREYSTEESPGFVNGILDAVYKEMSDRDTTQT